MANHNKKHEFNIPPLYHRQEMFPDYDFPLTAMLVPHPNGNIPEHRHEFIEIVLIFRGRGTHRVLKTEKNTNSFPISTGDMFMVGQGIKHSFTDCENLWVYNLLFMPEMLAGDEKYLTAFPVVNKLLFDSELPVAPIHLSGNTLYFAIEQLNRIIEEINNRNTGFELVAKTALLELLLLSGRISVKVTDNVFSSHHQAVHRAFDYMEKHFAKPLTLSVLAREARMSQSYFCRKFKAITALTPWECLTQLRLEKTKELLLSTDLSIEEIAQKTGLCDGSYLTKTFKKQERTTPQQFRSRWNRI